MILEVEDETSLTDFVGRKKEDGRGKMSRNAFSINVVLAQPKKIFLPIADATLR